MTKTTFSTSVKNEIASESSFSLERKKALISAYLRINGTLLLSKGKEGVRIRSENSKIIRYIYESLKEIFPDYAFHFQYIKKGKSKISYVIEIRDAREILDLLGVDYFEGKIPKDIVYSDETIAGYIAGSFLASGSINSPKTSNYHLEISLNSENYAKWLEKLFGKYKKLDFEPKMITRRNKYVIYFKKSDQISNFLIMIGAPETCMEFEGERVKRDFMNAQNRLDNFDMANMKKASEIGRRQAKEIAYIDDVLGVHNLHNQKKELLCYLRMENKELTLSELADLISEEMGIVVTKSNVNHLFRSLHELYLKLKGAKL